MSHKEYDGVFTPIREEEMKQWKPITKSSTTRLFEEFLGSDDKMVEVNMVRLSEPKSREGAKVQSTKQDSFASSFYAWKRKRKDYFSLKGIDVILIRRGEKVALKKVKRNKEE
jgi:hypothetical protein